MPQLLMVEKGYSRKYSIINYIDSQTILVNKKKINCTANSLQMSSWLVTGASSGLGAAIAETALRAGNKVLATARNPAKAALENSTIADLGGIWVRVDVTQTDTSHHVEKIIRENGGSKIDVVVNNAGYSLLGSIEDMSEVEIEKQFSTNLFGPIRVLKGVLPFMRAQRSGTVVNVSSSAGFEAFPGCAMYAGSKFALEGENGEMRS